MADLSDKKKKTKDISMLLMFHFLAHTEVRLQTGEQLKFLQAVAKSIATMMGWSISQNYPKELFPLSSIFSSQFLSLKKKNQKQQHQKKLFVIFQSCFTVIVIIYITLSLSAGRHGTDTLGSY